MGSIMHSCRRTGAELEGRALGCLSAACCLIDCMWSIPGRGAWAKGGSLQGPDGQQSICVKFQRTARSIYQIFSGPLLCARLSEKGQGYRVDKTQAWMAPWEFPILKGPVINYDTVMVPNITQLCQFAHQPCEIGLMPSLQMRNSKCIQFGCFAASSGFQSLALRVYSLITLCFPWARKRSLTRPALQIILLASSQIDGQIGREIRRTDRIDGTLSGIPGGYN